MIVTLAVIILMCFTYYILFSKSRSKYYPDGKERFTIAYVVEHAEAYAHFVAGGRFWKLHVHNAVTFIYDVKESEPDYVYIFENTLGVGTKAELHLRLHEYVLPVS